MSLNIDSLANELSEAFKQTNTITSYNATTGKKTTKKETTYPDKDKMKILSQTLINHIQKNSEIKGVESTTTVSKVDATVAPGIPVSTTGGPGATTGPGTAVGTGSGTSKQSNTVRVK